MESKAVFDKNTVEFVTVAAEYCTILVNSGEKNRTQFLDVLTKLLSLLYLKASMIPDIQPEGLYLEESVTEQEYDSLRAELSRKLGEYDDYLDVFVEEMKYSDAPVRKCISEDLCDIYQALKNFIDSYRSGLPEVMEESVAVCRDSFCTYWGQTLANTLRAVHCVHYGQKDDDEEEELW